MAPCVRNPAKGALILLIALVVPLVVASNASAKVDVTNLGPGIARGINQAGLVVGSSGPHASLWQNGKMTDLGAPPGDTFSDAWDINDAGQVVGYSQNYSSGASHAFIWGKGIFTNLGTLDGATPVPEAVNNAGQVVGNIPSNSAAGYPQRAIRWERGNLTDLGGLSGFGSAAHDINDAGLIVGESRNGYDETRAVLWRQGTITDLGTFSGDSASAAYGINRAGLIVGYSYNMYRGYKAVLWGNGTIKDLGKLPGHTNSWAEAINNAAQIVGVSYNFTASGLADMHAVLWQDGVVTDLGAISGWAYDLNDAGQAVGTDGEGRALLWAVLPDRLGASLSASRAATYVGVAISFTCTPTGGTPPYAASWGFGDGSGGSGVEIRHAYASAGKKTATCVVTDEVGTTVTSSTTVEVYPVSVVMASVNQSKISAVVGEVVTFSAVAEGGSGGPYTFSWDFGDGAKGTGASVEHTYQAPGSYSPRLTVADAAGASKETVLETITVRAEATGPSGSSIALPIAYVESGIVGVASAVGLTLVLRRRMGREH